MKYQTKALYQARRRANPVMRSLEQSSNTVRWRNARTNQAVQEHESEQWAAAREEPGGQEQEQSADTLRRAIVRTDQGVQEHESEQQAAEREEPGVRLDKERFKVCCLSSVVCHPSSVVCRPYLLSSHISTLVHRISNFTLRSIH